MPKPTIQNPPPKLSSGFLGNNWLLAIAVIALAVFPLVFIRGDYTGSDNQAQGAIKELHPTYVPWFKPFFKPASSEIEGLLFVSQAALGAGVMGYVIGLYKGCSQKAFPGQQPDDRSSP